MDHPELKNVETKVQDEINKVEGFGKEEVTALDTVFVNYLPQVAFVAAVALLMGLVIGFEIAKHFWL